MISNAGATGRDTASASTPVEEHAASVVVHGSVLTQVRIESWKALGLAIRGATRAERDEAWNAVLTVLSVLGVERLEGWKGIAAAIGVSITRARELADRQRPFQLPVRYGARGVYVTRFGLALWLAQYDAPYGSHASLKAPRRPAEKAAGT